MTENMDDKPSNMSIFLRACLGNEGFKWMEGDFGKF
jgi:hypothetical protein